MSQRVSQGNGSSNPSLVAHWLGAIALCGLVPGYLFADVIKLKDGGEIRGTVKPADPKARREKVAGAEDLVIESDIKKHVGIEVFPEEVVVPRTRNGVTGEQVSATTRAGPSGNIAWVVGGETTTSAPSSSKEAFHIE